MIKNNSEYEKENNAGLFGATLLVTLGITLLLNNFGVIPWSIWQVLWHFWPLLIIMAGLEMIAGTSSFAKTIVTLLGILLIIFTLIYSLSIVDLKFQKKVNEIYPGWKKIQNILPFKPEEETNQIIIFPGPKKSI